MSGSFRGCGIPHREWGYIKNSSQILLLVDENKSCNANKILSVNIFENILYF